MKKCTKCRINKPYSEFFKDSQKKSGIRPDCKVCNTFMATEYAKKNKQAVHVRNLKYKYGLLKNEYFNMLEKQNGKCAICLEISNVRLSVDHCHKTLKVRGLLCHKCNRGLGSFNDDISKMKNAIRYLNKNKII